MCLTQVADDLICHILYFEGPNFRIYTIYQFFARGHRIHIACDLDLFLFVVIRMSQKYF